VRTGAALPFTIRRSNDLIARGRITTVTETVHGLLRLGEDDLHIQWRIVRQTDRVGDRIDSTQQLGDLREVIIPLAGVAGAAIRRRWAGWWKRTVLVLTAADLRAFEEVTGEGGLRLDHPAELVLRLRPTDRLAAAEFAADLAVAIAERALGEAGARRIGPASGPRQVDSRIMDSK
jgi:hypothetical protein